MICKPGLEAELVFQQPVDALNNVIHHRLGRVIDPAQLAQLGVVGLQEGLVKVNDRVATLAAFAEILQHPRHVRVVERLNQILADTLVLYHLYKKHHWMMRGHTFYQLHLLLDEHANEQLELIDMLAELKMIRSMQLRVNSRTNTYARQYQGEQANDPDIRKELEGLADRQARIFDATNNLARGKAEQRPGQ